MGNEMSMTSSDYFPDDKCQLPRPTKCGTGQGNEKTRCGLRGDAKMASTPKVEASGINHLGEPVCRVTGQTTDRLKDKSALAGGHTQPV